MVQYVKALDLEQEVGWNPSLATYLLCYLGQTTTQSLGGCGKSKSPEMGACWSGQGGLSSCSTDSRQNMGRDERGNA